MESFLGLTQTEWTGIYSILTLGLLIAAIWAAIYAFHQWKDARKAQEEENRPYVIVIVDPSPASPQLFDLVVRNIGKRPAKNVAIKLDPPPIRAREVKGLEMRNIKLLNEPVAMIAPGQELRAFYDNAVDRKGNDDLPTAHTVSLSYMDSSGETYEENSSLDLDALKGTLFTAVHTVHSIGKSMQNIDQTLSKASLLHPKGTLQADVSTESRDAREEREAKERIESRNKASQLLEHLGFNEDGSRISDDGLPDVTKEH